MDKEMMEGLDIEKLSRIAVGYLLQHEDLRPVGTEKLFAKLIKYNDSMEGIMQAIEQAKRSVREMQTKAEQMFGSIESVVELIAEELPKDKVTEWCNKYEFSPKMTSMIKQRKRDVDVAGSAAKNQDKLNAPDGVDMAGSTAKLQPPPPIPADK